MNRFLVNDVIKLVVTIVLLLILLPSVCARFSTGVAESPATGEKPLTQETEEATALAQTTEEATTPSPSEAGEEASATQEVENAGQIERAVPTLDLPAGALTAGSLTLSGTGEPGSQIEIVVDGQVIGTATVAANGRWSFDASSIEPGEHQISINGLDASGSAYASSEVVTLPVAASAVDVAIPTIDLPSAELFTGSVTLLGTGEPATGIELRLNDEPFVRTTVDDAGLWAATGTIDEPGEYEVVVNALDEAGHVVAASEPVVIPVVSLGSDVTPPTFDLPVAELTSGEITLTGTGEPGSEVEIVVDSDVVGTVTVGEDGFWSWTGSIDQPGNHQVVINSLDADGNVIAASNPAPLTIAAPDVTVPALISPQAGDTLLAGRQTFRGTGEPETELEIVVDGESMGTTTVRDNGAWSFAETIDGTGEIEVVINALDAEGEVVASSEAVTLILTEPEEVIVEEEADETGLVCQEEYTVVADDWLSKLADKYFGDLFLYPAIVTATNEKHAIDDTFAEIENPDVIEPGWKVCIVETEVAESLIEEEN
ncbi:MAG: hypothetical protein KDI62_06760 [Anaerolineae bacterium]|nr:hypothetical protein [Anaerolineae bacterium]MCB9102986.1 hypothetical protein [Anaerolineales bacterium]